VHRHQFGTRSEARLKIAIWINGFYNQHRRRSVCDWRLPIDYERSFSRVLEDQAAYGTLRFQGLTRCLNLAGERGPQIGEPAEGLIEVGGLTPQ
jgi:hypothetical protein